MSASLLSGGGAPSSVALDPKVAGICIANNGLTSTPFANTATGVPSLVVQQSSSCQQPVINPGAGQTQALGSSVSNTVLAIVQPPFATDFSTGAAVSEGQSQFVFSCPNATAAGGGAPGGALTLYSYVNGQINNALFNAPKPSLTANFGDDILQLMGGSQSGSSTIAVGNTAANAQVLNSSITAGAIILCSLKSGAATQAGGYFATIVAGTGFTVTSTVAVAGADAVVNYFIVRY